MMEMALPVMNCGGQKLVLGRAGSQGGGLTPATAGIGMNSTIQPRRNKPAAQLVQPSLSHRAGWILLPIAKTIKPVMKARAVAMVGAE